MICPDCNTMIDDRSEVCPECGAVVAGEETSMEHQWSDDDTDVGGKKLPTPDNPDLTGPLPLPADIGKASGGEAAVGTQVVKVDPESRRGTQVTVAPLPPAVKKRQRERAQQKGQKVRARAQSSLDLELEESGVSRTIDELVKGSKLFYARLHRFDRWTVWILIVTFIASFLPWCRVLSYGLTAGIQDYGLYTAPLAALAFLLIYLRTARRRLTLSLLLLQLIVVAATGAVVVWRYLSAADTTFTYGIYLTFLGAGLAMIATLLRTARVNV